MHVEIINEVKQHDGAGWCLCFQYCTYKYDDGNEENGYRFIWRRPDGTLLTARGQARIPSLADIQELTAKAIREGWKIV